MALRTKHGPLGPVGPCHASAIDRLKWTLAGATGTSGEAEVRKALAGVLECWGLDADEERRLAVVLLKLYPPPPQGAAAFAAYAALGNTLDLSLEPELLSDEWDVFRVALDPRFDDLFRLHRTARSRGSASRLPTPSLGTSATPDQGPRPHPAAGCHKHAIQRLNAALAAATDSTGEMEIRRALLAVLVCWGLHAPRFRDYARRVIAALLTLHPPRRGVEATVLAYAAVGEALDLEFELELHDDWDVVRVLWDPEFDELFRLEPVVAAESKLLWRSPGANKNGRRSR